MGRKDEKIGLDFTQEEVYSEMILKIYFWNAFNFKSMWYFNFVGLSFFTASKILELDYYKYKYDLRTKLCRLQNQKCSGFSSA